MNEHDTPDPRGRVTEFEDLDGHTIEKLSDYLDAGRTPVDASIEGSPGCRIALDALTRLRELTPELLASDTSLRNRSPTTPGCRVFSLASLWMRAPGGASHCQRPAPDADLGITEGAVRGVIRAAEHTVPGVVIGKCRFDGDVTVPGEPVRVRVDVSVPYGEPIPDLAERLRTEISARVMTHTTLNVTSIDITVHDIQQLQNRTEGNR